MEGPFEVLNNLKDFRWFSEVLEEWAGEECEEEDT